MSLSELQRIKREFMASLERRETGALTRMVDSYAEIVNGLQSRAEQTWLTIERRRAEGEDISQSALFQDARVRSLLEQAEREFVTWSNASLGETEALRVSAVRIAGDAVRAELEMLTTPPGQSGSVVSAFDILPVDAIAGLLGALTPGAPVSNLFADLPANISAEMRKALVVGLAVGENPRAVGRRMVKASAGGLANGVRIARTEMMRAYRGAHQENYRRNADVVKGWIWLSARNARTCAGCLAMHGTFHTLDEELDDHPNGRCTPLPVTKSWAELGYGDQGWAETSIGEDGVESGEDWFARQNADLWQRVLGKGGAEAYQGGRVKLVDFAGIKSDSVWGKSIYQRSLADALKAAEARKQAEEGGRRRQAQPKPGTLAASRPVRSANQPTGTPVSVALDPDSDIRALVDSVAAAIDKVHGDGALPTLPIRFAQGWLDRLQRGVAGAYRRSSSNDQPHSIILAKGMSQKRMTLAHELGHFLDHAAIGGIGKLFGSEASPLLAKWRAAVFASKTVQAFETHRDNMLRDGRTVIHLADGDHIVPIAQRFLDYLLTDKELFARAYAQYVAVRSGDKAMMRELRAAQNLIDAKKGLYFSYQWPDDEFEPIAKALDQAFMELGWLTNYGPN